jgi:hypothetical protein
VSEPRPGKDAPEIPEQPRPRPETPGPADRTVPEMPVPPRWAEPESPGRPERKPEAPADPNEPGG